MTAHMFRLILAWAICIFLFLPTSCRVQNLLCAPNCPPLKQTATQELMEVLSVNVAAVGVLKERTHSES